MSDDPLLSLFTDEEKEKLRLELESEYGKEVLDVAFEAFENKAYDDLEPEKQEIAESLIRESGQLEDYVWAGTEQFYNVLTGADTTSGSAQKVYETIENKALKTLQLKYPDRDQRDFTGQELEDTRRQLMKELTGLVLIEGGFEARSLDEYKGLFQSGDISEVIKKNEDNPYVIDYLTKHHPFALLWDLVYGPGYMPAAGGYVPLIGNFAGGPATPAQYMPVQTDMVKTQNTAQETNQKIEDLGRALDRIQTKDLGTFSSPAGVVVDEYLTQFDQLQKEIHDTDPFAEVAPSFKIRSAALKDAMVELSRERDDIYKELIQSKKDFGPVYADGGIKKEQLIRLSEITGQIDLVLTKLNEVRGTQKDRGPRSKVTDVVGEQYYNDFINYEYTQTPEELEFREDFVKAVQSPSEFLLGRDPEVESIEEFKLRLNIVLKPYEDPAERKTTSGKVYNRIDRVLDEELKEAVKQLNGAYATGYYTPQTKNVKSKVLEYIAEVGDTTPLMGLTEQSWEKAVGLSAEDELSTEDKLSLAESYTVVFPRLDRQVESNITDAFTESKVVDLENRYIELIELVNANAEPDYIRKFWTEGAAELPVLYHLDSWAEWGLELLNQPTDVDFQATKARFDLVEKAREDSLYEKQFVYTADDKLDQMFRSLQKVTRMSDAVMNPDEVQFDGSLGNMLYEINQKDGLDKVVREYFSGKRVKDLPMILQAAVKSADQKHKDNDSFLIEKDVDSLLIVDVQNDYRDSYGRPPISVEDIKHFISFRQEVLDNGAGFVTEELAEMMFTPVFSYNDGEATYSKKLTAAGYALQGVLPLAQRFVIEAGSELVFEAGSALYKSGLVDVPPEFTRPPAGIFAPIMLWRPTITDPEGLSLQQPSVTSRVLANMYYGDPGLSGDMVAFASDMGASETVERLVHDASMILDLVVPYESIATAPVKTVSRTATRTYRNIRAAGADIADTDVRPAQFLQPKQPLEGDGFVTAGLNSARNAYNNFISGKEFTFDPARYRQMIKKGMKYTFETGVPGQTILWTDRPMSGTASLVSAGFTVAAGGAAALDLMFGGGGLVSGGPAYYLAYGADPVTQVVMGQRRPVLQEETYEANRTKESIKNGTMDMSDFYHKTHYHNMRDQLELGLDPLDLRQRMQQMGLDPDSTEGNQYAKFYVEIRDLMDEYARIQGFVGIDELRKMIGDINADQLPEILHRSRAIQKEMGDIPASIKKSEGYKAYDSVLRRTLQDEDQISWHKAMSVAFAELAYPDNPAAYFKKATVDIGNLPDITFEKVGFGTRYEKAVADLEVADVQAALSNEELFNGSDISEIMSRGIDRVAEQNSTYRHMDLPVDKALYGRLGADEVEAATHASLAKAVMDTVGSRFTDPDIEMRQAPREFADKKHKTLATLRLKTSDLLVPSTKSALLAEIDALKTKAEPTRAEKDTLAAKQKSLQNMMIAEGVVDEMSLLARRKKAEAGFAEQAAREAEPDPRLKSKAADQARNSVERRKTKSFRVQTKVSDGNVKTIVRFREVGDTLMVDSMASDLAYNSTYRSRKPRGQIYDDYHHRKIAVNEIMRFAAERGYEKVRLPLGETGMFAQYWGAGERLGYEAYEKKLNEKIKANETKLKDLEKEKEGLADKLLDEKLQEINAVRNELELDTALLAELAENKDAVTVDTGIEDLVSKMDEALVESFGEVSRGGEQATQHVDVPVPVSMKQIAAPLEEPRQRAFYRDLKKGSMPADLPELELQGKTPKQKFVDEITKTQEELKEQVTTLRGEQKRLKNVKASKAADEQLQQEVVEVLNSRVEEMKLQQETLKKQLELVQSGIFDENKISREVVVSKYSSVADEAADSLLFELSDEDGKKVFATAKPVLADDTEVPMLMFQDFFYEGQTNQVLAGGAEARQALETINKIIENKKRQRAQAPLQKIKGEIEGTQKTETELPKASEEASLKHIESAKTYKEALADLKPTEAALDAYLKGRYGIGRAAQGSVKDATSKRISFIVDGKTVELTKKKWPKENAVIDVAAEQAKLDAFIEFHQARVAKGTTKPKPAKLSQTEIETFLNEMGPDLPDQINASSIVERYRLRQRAVKITKVENKFSQKKKDNLKENVEKLQSKTEEAKVALDAALEKKKGFATDIEKAERQIQRLEENKAKLEASLQNLAAEDPAFERLRTLTRRRDRQLEKGQDIKKLSKQITALEAEVKDKTGDLEEQIVKVQSKINKANTRLEALKESTVEGQTPEEVQKQQALTKAEERLQKAKSEFDTFDMRKDEQLQNAMEFFDPKEIRITAEKILEIIESIDSDFFKKIPERLDQALIPTQVDAELRAEGATDALRQDDAIAVEPTIPETFDVEKLFQATSLNPMMDAAGRQRASVRKIIAQASSLGYGTFGFSLQADALRHGIQMELDQMNVAYTYSVGGRRDGSLYNLLDYGIDTERARRSVSLVDQHLEIAGVRTSSLDADVHGYLAALSGQKRTDSFDSRRVPRKSVGQMRAMEKWLGVTKQDTTDMRRRKAEQSAFLSTATTIEHVGGMSKSDIDQQLFAIGRFDEDKKEGKLKDLHDRKTKFEDEDKNTNSIDMQIKSLVAKREMLLGLKEKIRQLPGIEWAGDLVPNDSRLIEYVLDGEDAANRAVLSEHRRSAAERRTVVMQGFLSGSDAGLEAGINKFAREAAARGFDAFAVKAQTLTPETLQKLASRWGAETDLDYVRSTKQKIEYRQHADKSAQSEWHASKIERLKELAPENDLARQVLESPDPVNLIETDGTGRYIELAKDLMLDQIMITRGAEKKMYQLVHSFAFPQESLESLVPKGRTTVVRKAPEPSRHLDLSMVYSLMNRSSAGAAEETLVFGRLNTVDAEAVDADLAVKVSMDQVSAETVAKYFEDQNFRDELSELDFKLMSIKPEEHIFDAPLMYSLREVVDEQSVQDAMNYVYTMEAAKEYAAKIEELTNGDINIRVDAKDLLEPDHPLVKNARLLSEVDYAGRSYDGAVRAADESADAQFLEAAGAEKTGDGEYRLREALPISNLETGLLYTDLVALSHGINLEEILMKMNDRLLDLQEGKIDLRRLRSAEAAVLLDGEVSKRPQADIRFRPQLEEGGESFRIFTRRMLSEEETVPQLKEKGLKLSGQEDLPAVVAAFKSMFDKNKLGAEYKERTPQQMTAIALHYLGFNRYNMSELTNWRKALFGERIVYNNLLEADNAFGKHRSSERSPLLSLLQLEYEARGMIDRPQRLQRPAPKGDAVISELPDQQRAPLQQPMIAIQNFDQEFRLRLPFENTPENFLMANAVLIERMLPDGAYSLLSRKYESAGGQLTSRGLSDMVQDFSGYVRRGEDIADGHTKMIFDRVFAVMDKMWQKQRTNKTLKNTSGDIVGRIRRTYETSWDSMFIPNQRSIKSAVLYLRDRPNKYRALIIPEQTVVEKEMGSRPAAAGSKRAATSTVMSNSEIMRDINSPSFGKKYDGMSIEIGKDGEEVRTFRFREYKAGDRMDPRDLYARYYALAMHEYLQRRGWVQPGNWRVLTRRTAVPQEKVEEILQGTRDTMEYLLGESQEDLAGKMRVMDQDTYYNLGYRGWYEPKQYLLVDRAAFLRLQAFANRLAGVSYVSKLVPEVFYMRNREALMLELNSSNPLGRKVFLENGQERFIVTGDEYNDLVEAITDHSVPAYARRNNDIRKMNRPHMNRFIDAILNFAKGYAKKQNSPTSSVAKFLVDIEDNIKAWLVTEDLSKYAKPAQVEAIKAAESRLNTLVARFLNKIEATAKLINSKYDFKYVTEKVFKLWEKELIQIKAPVPTAQLPLLFKIYSKFEALDKGADASSAAQKLNATDLFDLEFLDNVENVFSSSTFRLGASEAIAIDAMREYSFKYKQDGLSSVITTGMEGQEFYGHLSTIKEGINKRKFAVDQAADTIIKALTGFDPLEANMNLEMLKVAQQRRRAYTLFYNGRIISVGSALWSDIEKITPENFKARVGTELTQDAAVEFLRDHGVSLYSAKDNAIIVAANKLLDPDDHNFQTISKMDEALRPQEYANLINKVLNYRQTNTGSLVSFAADLPSKATALSAKDMRTDPSAFMTSIFLGLERNSIMEKLAEDLVKADYPDMYGIYELARKNYGFNPVHDATGMTKTVINKVQQRLNMGDIKIAAAGDFTDPEIGLQAARAGEQFAVSEAALQDDLTIRLHSDRVAENYSSDFDKMAESMTSEILSKIGMRARGYSNLDPLQQITIGSKTFIVHKDIAESLNAIQTEIISVGKSAGSVGARHISDINKAVEKAATKAKLILPEDASTELRSMYSDISKTILAASLGSGFLVGTAGSIGAGLATAGVGFLTGRAILTLASKPLEKSFIRKNPDLGPDPKLQNHAKLATSILIHKALEAGELAVSEKFIKTINNTIDEVVELKPGIGRFKIPRIIMDQKNLVGFAKVGGASVAFYTVASTVGILAALGAAATVRFTYKNAKNFLDKYNARRSSTETAKKIDELVKKLEDLHQEEVIENTAVSRNFISRIKDENERLFADAELYEKTKGQIAATTFLEQAGIATNQVLESFIHNFLRFDNLTSHLKMAVTAYAGPAYWAGNYFGLFQQSMLGQGLTRENLGFLVGGGFGVAAGLGFGGGVFPGAMMGVAGSHLGKMGASMLGVSKGQKSTKNILTAGMHQMLGGPSSRSRPSQILMCLYAHERTPTSVLAGAHGGMFGAAFGSMFGAPTTGAAIGAMAVSGMGQKIVPKVTEPKTVSSFPPVIAPNGKIYGFNELMTLMDEYNVFSTYIKEETGRLVSNEVRDLFPQAHDNLLDWFGGKKYQRMMMDIAESMDIYYRVGTFIEMLEKGHHPSEAAKLVNKLYFDYTDLTEKEKSIMRNVFLFYSFTRKNIEFLIYVLFRHPSRVAGWYRVQKEMQKRAYETSDTELFIDDFYLGRIPFFFLDLPLAPPDTALGIRGVDGFVPVSPMMNHYDLVLFMKLLGDPNLLLQQMTPLIQAPIVAGLGVKPFGKMPLERQAMNPDLINAANSLGINIFGTEDSDALIKYKTVPWKEQFTEEKTPQQLISTYLKPKSGTLERGVKYMPASTTDGMMYEMFANIGMPAVAQKLPIVGLAAQRVSGRSGDIMQQFDRGDLSEVVFSEQETRMYGLLSGAILKTLETSGLLKTTSMEKIFLEAKTTTDPKLKDRPDEVFKLYFQGDKNDGMFISEFFIRPKNVPPEFYQFQMVGMRMIPKVSIDVAIQKDLQSLERKLNGQED